MSVGRPRSAEADAAIVRSTLELLREEGFRGLSVEAVRARAGVGKATIYRRYPDKSALVRAAMGAIHADLELPDTGSVRGDLEAAFALVYATGLDSGTLVLMPRLLAEATSEPELHAAFTAALVEPRRGAFHEILSRGVRRGELPQDADLDLITDLITGPIIYRLLIERGEIADPMGYIRRVLDAVLAPG